MERSGRDAEIAGQCDDLLDAYGAGVSRNACCERMGLSGEPDLECAAANTGRDERAERAAAAASRRLVLEEAVSSQVAELVGRLRDALLSARAEEGAALVRGAV